MPSGQSEAAFQSQIIQLAHTFNWLVQHTRPAKQGARSASRVGGGQTTMVSTRFSSSISCSLVSVRRPRCRP